jgi:Flavin reductase like domain
MLFRPIRGGGRHVEEAISGELYRGVPLPHYSTPSPHLIWPELGDLRPPIPAIQSKVGCGDTSGRRVDKFRVFRLTPAPASLVAAPLIGECYANLECKVVDTRMVGKYSFFILEVSKAWVDPSKKAQRTIHHLGRGAFMVAGRTITLPSKMK